MKTINMVKVVKGSLQIVDGGNGFYLYGTTPDKVVTFLGSLGDGVGFLIPKQDYDPNDDIDLEEAYQFELVEVA